MWNLYIGRSDPKNLFYHIIPLSAEWDGMVCVLCIMVSHIHCLCNVTRCIIDVELRMFTPLCSDRFVACGYYL